MADRDLRIDFFRGLALVMIFVNHLPGNVFAFGTLANLGFSDAAEVFVLLAGVSAVYAYSKVAEREGFLSAALAVFARMRQLYVTHLVLFLLVTAVAAFAAQRFGDPMYLEAMALDSFVSEPADAILHVITLTYLPSYLDILPLYVVLLALVPALLLAFRLHPLAPLALSALVFAASRIVDLNLPNYPETRVWFFNPAAWQLLFVIGATIGHLTLKRLWRVPFAPLVTVASALYVAFAFVVAAPWTDIPALAGAALIPASSLPPIDKTGLSLFRLANVLAQAWLVATLLPRSGGFMSGALARPLIVAGRHSLEVFALGVVLSVAGTVAMKESGYTLEAQFAVVGLGLALMLGYAHLVEMRAGRRRVERASVREEAASPT